MLFGQAGFLEETFSEKYPLKLQQEYLYFKKKYNLTPLNKSFWKFGKLRPSNFPTIRLAQFALLIHKSNHLFSKILNEMNKYIGQPEETQGGVLISAIFDKINNYFF